MSIDKDELESFLQKHKTPLIVSITTIKPGYVSYINPVPTICGAEIHVNPATKSELHKLIDNFLNR